MPPAGTTQCPGYARVPTASPFPPFWEGFGRLRRVHFPWPPARRSPLSPSAGKGLSLQEGSCGQALQPGLLLSSPLPGASLLLQARSRGFWGRWLPGMILIIFSLCQTALHIRTRWGGGGSCTPRVSAWGFCNLSLAGDSLLSSWHDAPPCQDRIRPSKVSSETHACYPQGYPCSMVQKSKMLKTPSPLHPPGTVKALAGVLPSGTSPTPAAGTPRVRESSLAPPVTFLVLHP